MNNGSNGHAPVLDMAAPVPAAPQTVQMKTPHLFIGTPCHDNRWHAMYGMSMISLVGAGKVAITTAKVSGGGIHKARNNIAHDFMKSTADRLLFIDSDISFKPEQVFQLIARDLPIVASPYTHKKPADPKTNIPAWSARAIDGEVPQSAPGPRQGLQKVAAVGTGFLMIKREVFETISKTFAKEIGYIEDWNEGAGEHKFDFFPEGRVHDPEMGYPEPTFITEDFGFCRLARKCVYEIMVDCSSFVRHWEGSRGYPETLQDPPPAPMPDHVNETDILHFRR